jgi:hypothetical protein
MTEEEQDIKCIYCNATLYKDEYGDFPCKNCIVMFGYDDNELHYIGYIRKNHMIGVDMLNNITMLIESGDDFDEEKPLVHLTHTIDLTPENVDEVIERLLKLKAFT